MKIAVDVRSLLAPSGRGVAHYTSALLEEMTHVHPDDEWVLVYTGRSALHLPESLSGRTTLSSKRLPNKVLNLTIGLTGRPRLDALAGGADVFFAPNFGFLGLAPSTPLVLTIHDLSFVTRPEFYSNRDRLWHWLNRARGLARRAARIIAVSSQTKQEVIERYGVDAEKIAVIPSGIDAAYSQPVTPDEAERVRRKYRLPDNYCLFVGALEPRKNIGGLLEAYRLAKRRGLRSELVLAGASAGQVGRVVADSTAAIHALGYVDEADKPALYAGALVNLLLSHHEGFGFTPLEALAAGTPSIVSDLPIFYETVGDTAIRVDPSDASAVAENLVHLEREPAARTRLLSDRDAVLARHSWAEAARDTYAVLQEATHS